MASSKNLVGGTCKITGLSGTSYPDQNGGALDVNNADYVDESLLSPKIPSSVTSPGSPTGWAGAVSACEDLQKVYFTPSGSSPLPSSTPASYKTFVAQGGKLLVSVKPTPYSSPWSTSTDNGITNFFTALYNDLGPSSFKVVLYQEMLHDSNFPTAASYQAYVEHYGQLIRNISTSIVLAYDPNGFDQAEAVTYYPGDQWVDEIGCDYYSTAYIDYGTGAVKSNGQLDNLAALADGHTSGSTSTATGRNGNGTAAPIPFGLFEMGFWAGSKPTFNLSYFEQYCTYLVDFFTNRISAGGKIGWLIWFFSDPDGNLVGSNAINDTMTGGVPNDPKIPGIQKVWQNLASQAITSPGESGNFGLVMPAPVPSLAGKVGHVGSFTITLPAPETSFSGSQLTVPFVYAEQAISSPASSNTISVTTATQASESLIVMMATGSPTSAPTVTGVSDSKGNTYTLTYSSTSPQPFLFIYEATGATIALTTSDTVTVTLTGLTSNDILDVACVCAPGAGNPDVTTATSGTSTSPSVSGTPTQAGEIALSAFSWTNIGGAGTMAAPFTQLTQVHTGSQTYLTVGYDLDPAANTSLTSGETITSANWHAALLTFEAGVSPSGNFTPAIPPAVTGLSGVVVHQGPLAINMPIPTVDPDSALTLGGFGSGDGILYNDCINPSFEVSTAGWTPTTGATITQTGVTAWSGRYCAVVTTDGLATEEGVTSPPYQFLTTSPVSVQLRLAGPSGTLQITVAKNPGGAILATQTVTLTNDWANVQIQGLTVNANDSLYLIITTAPIQGLVEGAGGAGQALTFYIDAVMYEPAATLDPYFDGDSAGASWLGQQGLSVSEMLQPGAMSLHGGMYMGGLLSVIAQGQIIQVVPASGQATMSGTIGAVSGVSPAAALDDFASWETSTDYDPAMTYVTWNTAGLASGHTAYTRPWAIFYPPLDYPTSAGTNLWNRAAFAAVGFEYASVAAGAAQNLTCVQLEMMPLAGTNSLDQTPAPSAYDPSRTLHAIIKPTRLNYAQNPAFQSSTLGFPVTPGSYTTPPAYQIFDSIILGPGTYIVEWTVTLAGTVSSSDANNFAIAIGSNVIAQSVNAGAAGTYPQTPVTVTVPPGGGFGASLNVKSWSTAATTGAVYGATMQAGSWQGSGNGILSFDPQVSYPLGGSYDGQPLSTLDQSGLVTISSGYGGCTQQLQGLFTGDTYIASIYVQPGAGITDFQLTAGNQVSASIAGTPGTDLTSGTWYRLWVIFTAPAPVATLTVTAITDVNATFPVTFNAGPCLAESGDILGSYFDGSFASPDYLWETGSTAGLGRSYYYQDYAIQQSVITDIMSRHTPLGLTWAPPVYAQLPTQ